ncbi:unnamed protein product [Lampetra fluviatilis]
MAAAPRHGGVGDGGFPTPFGLASSAAAYSGVFEIPTGEHRRQRPQDVNKPAARRDDDKKRKSPKGGKRRMLNDGSQWRLSVTVTDRAARVLSVLAQRL